MRRRALCAPLQKGKTKKPGCPNLAVYVEKFWTLPSSGGTIRPMNPPNSEIAMFALYLAAVALCMLRAPQSDRWHALLCVMTAGIWGTLWIVNPALRTHTFVSSVGTWLSIAAFRSWRRRQSDISS